MIPEIFDDFYEDGEGEPQTPSTQKSMNSEAIYLHGTRTILQSITIDPKIESNPVRDAKVLEAMLSTTLPEDTFSILLMHMAQTLEHRRKMKQVYEEMKKIQEATMRAMYAEQAQASETMQEEVKVIKTKKSKKEKTEETEVLPKEDPPPFPASEF